MSAPNNYDQNLLGAAPAATKEQLQEGYNVDLLKGRRGASTTPAPPPHSTDVEAAFRRPKEYNPVDASAPGKPRTSFFQTTRGRIVIIVAVIVVIAVVGGAVGGTVGKKKTAAPP